MIKLTQGNLLDANVEALVNTVNTVGVMGKGIALMFKERFPENFQRYALACRAGEIQTGTMFVTKVNELHDPRWIINFPTKQHWRHPSQLEWIRSGLVDLRCFLEKERIRSIAIPPLGAGNGGLAWPVVLKEIRDALGDMPIDILVFEPTEEYQNVSKKFGVEKLTPSRALIAELVRRYWILGMECSLLEIQKLAWFLERSIQTFCPQNNPLKLDFEANRYGPYAHKLQHVLNHLDGSFLHCKKRISDASHLEVIWFDDSRKAELETYLATDEKVKPFHEALEFTLRLVDGFESPFGMELLATIDWLHHCEGIELSEPAMRQGLRHWKAGAQAGERKNRIFDTCAVEIAIKRLQTCPYPLMPHLI